VKELVEVDIHSVKESEDKWRRAGCEKYLFCNADARSSCIKW